MVHIRAVLCAIVPAAIAASSLLQGCADKSEPETVVYQIDGMHCEGCVTAITAKVMDIEGVGACTVSLEGHEATCEVADPAAKAKIVEAVTRLGYEISPKG